MSFPFLRQTGTSILAALLTVLLAAGAIGATWWLTEGAIVTQREQTRQQAEARVTAIAATYAEQLNRQILAFDQTLGVMTREWEANPSTFNLEAWRARSSVLSGISRDMFLTDENGIIRQSSVPEFIGQGASDLDIFRDAAEHANDKPVLALGPAAINPIMRQWHLDAARTLHRRDGSFAGIIDADYRVSAITDVFEAADIGPTGFATLIGMIDGKMRATSGPAATAPDSSIADTPMFGVIDAADNGLWTGPSASDAVVRFHAFRHLPGRDLAVVAGLDRDAAMRPATLWARQSRAFAAAIAVLVATMAGLIVYSLYRARRRAAKALQDQAQLAAANALAEVSRARADVTSRQLDAAFAGIDDGIVIVDAHLNLVEWNALFPERAGIGPSLVTVGQPIEDVLRHQAEQGYFGAVDNVDTEVQRRAALLRAGNFGDSQRFEAAGRTVEIHCQPLPDGGFVALYSDVTDTRRAHLALRQAATAIEAERGSRRRFLGVIAHELRAILGGLLQSIGLLHSTGPTAVQAMLLDRVRRTGEALNDLARSAVEVPEMEVGTLRPKPAIAILRPLLQAAVDVFQPVAAERRIKVSLAIADNAPVELIADPDRIRQVVTLILSEAVRFAAPGTMWLMAGMTRRAAGESGPEALWPSLTIRAFGPPIAAPVRARMFRPLTEVAAPQPGGTLGTGLHLAIARHLTEMMDGHIACDTWTAVDGQTGNDFTVALPSGLLSGQSGRAPGEARPSARIMPRTRVLLVGAASGLQLAAATMLRRDGHMVDAATDGASAVRALNRAPYDIVFLDVDLPDIPGPVATRYIRHLPGPARTVPVIGLATSYSPAEAESWRAGGMDDVLIKPPSMRDIDDALTRFVWVGSPEGPAGPARPAWQGEVQEGIPVLSAPRVAELRTHIRGDQLVDMIDECVADLFHRLPALRRALANQATGAIAAQAHAMVGVAGGYGMAVLEARLRAVLNAVRDGRLDTIEGAAQVVEADLSRAAAAWKAVLREPEPAQ